ncbi:methyltransferase [Streptomyces sp. WAC01526]|uniref:protein-L-isoaspartate O-methyltransferase family protein n=1 Tax=Streptomyces sp. WAC01526 TaxID=2588709 RepID=UPI0011DF4303
MSTEMDLTASVLEELDLRPGRRVLDVGTGAGVTAAVACHVCGDTTVVTLDRDPNVAVAAQARIGALGFRPAVVSGTGESGWPEGAPYDRIFVSFALPSVPEAPVDQLGPAGVLLMHITTNSPSWPALAVVSRGPRWQWSPGARTGGSPRTCGRWSSPTGQRTAASRSSSPPRSASASRPSAPTAARRSDGSGLLKCRHQRRPAVSGSRWSRCTRAWCSTGASTTW